MKKSGKILMIAAMVITVTLLYCVSIPFSNYESDGNFASQLGSWAARSLQFGLLAFVIAKISKKQIGRVIYSILILTWTLFHSYDLQADKNFLNGLAEIESLQLEQVEIIDTFGKKTEMLNIGNVFDPIFLLSSEDRKIAREKLDVFSNLLTGLPVDMKNNAQHINQLVQNLKEIKPELAKELEQVFFDSQAREIPLQNETIKLMKASIRVAHQLIDYMEEKDLNFFVEENELHYLYQEDYEQIQMYLYQIAYNEQRIDEVNAEINNLNQDPHDL